jgi:hypothetical protein
MTAMPTSATPISSSLRSPLEPTAPIPGRMLGVGAFLRDPDFDVLSDAKRTSATMADLVIVDPRERVLHGPARAGHRRELDFGTEGQKRLVIIGPTAARTYGNRPVEVANETTEVRSDRAARSAGPRFSSSRCSRGKKREDARWLGRNQIR